MSCLTEDRVVEILDQGGLDATRPEERTHLETCEGCRDAWATVAAAAEVLVGARPKAVPGRWRLFPVAVAAAMLLTIVGVIAVRKMTKPIADPVSALLEGNPDQVRQASETLRRAGRKSLPGLLAARPRFKGSARLQSLQDLIFAIKQDGAADDPEKAAIFKRLEAKGTIKGEGLSLDTFLGWIRTSSKANVHLDPKVEGGTVDVLDLRDSSFRSLLDVLCAIKDLDYDVRYGVVFVSTPLRLWSTDPQVGLPEANAWRKQILAGKDLEVAGKLARVRVTVDMENGAASFLAEYLSEIFGFKVRLEGTLGENLVTVKVSDLPVCSLVELLTLPSEADARIENESVIFFPKR